MDRVYDMLVVGGGPGGYTAALYAARAGLSVAVMEKLSAGGQMALTRWVDNYPGFEKGIEGFDLGSRMQAGAERFGAKTVLADVLRAELAGPIKVLHTQQGAYYGRTAVIATGAEPRKLELPGEAELTGHGVHYCAACDGMFYRDKTVMLVGGGNSAAADGLLLSKLCKKVLLVHRRDTLRATKVYHEPLLEAGNVEFLWNSRVTALRGTARLASVAVEHIPTGQIREVEVDGLFVAIGRRPASELAAGQLARDESGYVLADESTQTNLPGVYAVGDVRTKAVRQIVTAVADGASAAHAAQVYLAKEDKTISSIANRI